MKAGIRLIPMHRNAWSKEARFSVTLPTARAIDQVLGAVRHLIPDRLILDFGVLFREMLGRTVSPFLVSGGKPIPSSPRASAPLISEKFGDEGATSFWLF
jgi:hypothetical protein